MTGWSPWALLAPSWAAAAALALACSVDASARAVPQTGGLRLGLSHANDHRSHTWVPLLLVLPVAIFLALVCGVWAADHARAPPPAFCAPPDAFVARGAGQPLRPGHVNAGGHAYSSACFRSIASPLYVPLGVLLMVAMSMNDD